MHAHIAQCVRLPASRVQPLHSMLVTVSLAARSRCVSNAKDKQLHSNLFQPLDTIRLLYPKLLQECITYALSVAAGQACLCRNGAGPHGVSCVVCVPLPVFVTLLA